MKISFWTLFFILFALASRACIWDAETLFQEKLRNHDLAKAILGKPPAADDPSVLAERIKGLLANRNEHDADWWNNLAGAYLRLNQPETAVTLLEPVVKKFPNNYGIHANLGTAYHLLGRYAEAEEEIARDLEINPNAHFGLEKYHLSLLEYLTRDATYQSRHVYVDEFTAAFLVSGKSRLAFPATMEKNAESNAQHYTNGLTEAESDYQSAKKAGLNGYPLMETLAEVAALDSRPRYRTRWNLADDSHFEAGVIYMAQMNPKEPACYEMLGIAAYRKRDFNLAVAAYEKAIALGSPKSTLLQEKVSNGREYIRESLMQEIPMWGFLSLVPLTILYYTYTKIRDRRRRKPGQE